MFNPDSVQENSENIWKLNRYDLVIEYWGKTPLSCTPFVMFEHFLLLIKKQFFCGLTSREENKITCWPRAPGDHALSLGTFYLSKTKNYKQINKTIKKTSSRFVASIKPRPILTRLYLVLSSLNRPKLPS